MPDGIDLILEDHLRVDELFADFAGSGDPTLVGQIFDALTAHDDAEHSALYPLVGEVLGDTALVERCAAGHSLVKQQIDRMKFLEGPPLVAEVVALQKLVDSHAKEEEADVLPALREAATPAQIEVLGARILATKQRVG